jgi:hypothetical protein
MVLSAFTMFHVVLSLIGIGSDFVVLYGLLTSKRLDGWTMIFLTTTVATSVNVFALIVQLFLKVPSLKEIAPTQSEPAFQIAQLVALILFGVLAVRAAMKFHSEPPRTA